MSAQHDRALRTLALLGSALALLILGASLLLRLSTSLQADGAAASSLPGEIETLTRLLHRWAASSVAVLALTALVLGWVGRRRLRHLAPPIAWVVGATVLLALIGPLTPGYRVEFITVLNVTAGVVLLMAFWWLREGLRAQAQAATLDRAQRVALVAFGLHVATGAAASAWSLHGVHAVVFVHVGSLVLMVWALRRLPQPGQGVAQNHTQTLAGLMVLQLLCGAWLWYSGGHPVAVALLHALVAPVLGMVLVSALWRSAAPAPPTPEA